MCFSYRHSRNNKCTRCNETACRIAKSISDGLLTLHIHTENTTLILILPFPLFASLQKKDAGIFRCRVDFLLSPTKNSNVNLEIVGK